MQNNGEEQRTLTDSLGRTFSYLRLSLTDACNFRCQYCLPNGFIMRPKCSDPLEDTILQAHEIANLVRGFAAIGFRKVRLTGGEPTLRPDIIKVVEGIAATPGIETVALTTNGYRLDKIIDSLRSSGLNAINISMDSLDPKRFKEITGSDRFERVRAGLERALQLNFKSVKVNVVLLQEFIEKDLEQFFEFVRSTPISLRFIELMETGDNGEFFNSQYFSGDAFRNRLQAAGWSESPRSALDGPAREFAHPDYVGKVGIISPYSRGFCTTCNRLRVSSRGKLKLCLFGTGDCSLREFIQTPEQQPELIARIEELILNKAPSHYLNQRIFGDTSNLSSIGG